MIEFQCPGCQASYRVADELGGKRAKCKKCEAMMDIPLAAVVIEDDEPLEAELLGGSEPVVAFRGTPKLPDTFTTPPRGSAGGSGFQSNPAATAAKSTPGASPNLRGVTHHLKYEISQRPDYAMVTVQLEPGKKVFAEPAAMATMSPNMHLQAGLKGGVGKSLGRMLGGESLIVNTFQSTNGPGEVSFAAGTAGDVAYYALQGNSLFLQRGAFMVHSEGIELTGKWQGAKGFFSGEGLVLLKASGQGDLFFSSYGAILEVDVTDDYYVDTGYVVAFEDTLQYSIVTLPGLRGGSKLKSLFFSGEGLVCQFSGQGRVWIQTRHPQSFLRWVHPFRPVKSKN